MVPWNPSPVYETFWRFTRARQDIFQRRWRGQAGPWTDDHILRDYKFTNVFRASDRISQYLIRHVQYAGPQDARNLFYRTILFKLFNRRDTWEFLESKFGQLTVDTFDRDTFVAAVTARQRLTPIYSSAYIMPPVSHDGAAKHDGHLRLLQQMLADDLPEHIAASGTLSEVYELLRSYPGIGKFLAYQYAIDLNYSVLTNHSEMEFVVPGPGALRGIQKCFGSTARREATHIIHWIAAHQGEEQRSRGNEPVALFGRPLQLIDVQGLFCEVDKYARVAHPDVTTTTLPTRIKQHYRSAGPLAALWFPPKWGLNERVNAEKVSFLKSVLV